MRSSSKQKTREKLSLVSGSTVLVAVLLFLTLGGCASRGDMAAAQSDISSIWSRINFLSSENDQQNASLSRLEKNVIELSLLDDTTFELASSRLSPVATKRLARIGKILASYPKVKIVVSGHTDSSGSKRGNLKLSESRARSVADVLIENGVSASSIEVAGYGESMPFSTNSTASGRKLNRRVEIAIADETSRYERASMGNTPQVAP